MDVDKYLTDIKEMGNRSPATPSEEPARNIKTAETLLATQLLLQELGHSNPRSLKEARDALMLAHASAQKHLDQGDDGHLNYGRHWLRRFEAGASQLATRSAEQTR
jgi:hypothetical protein